MKSAPEMLDRYRGCLMGLALGDALCAGREGGPLEQLLWRLIGKIGGLHRYTDDTQMALDLAGHLIAHRSIVPDVLATDFARSYRWFRGYGPSTAHVLKQIRAGADWRVAARSKHPAGSYGNGAAMRAPVLALAYLGKPTEMEHAIDAASSITHPHPSAIMGARLICFAVAAGLNDVGDADLLGHLAAVAAGGDYERPLVQVRACMAQADIPEPGYLRQALGTGTAAVESCPASIFLGLRFRDRPIAELIAYINRCRGDTDTIAAMAGAIWGAYNGVERIPEPMRHAVEGQASILSAATGLHKAACQGTQAAL